MQNTKPADSILDIAINLEKTRQGIEYGEISVMLKIHQGKVVTVTYSRTEQARQNITQ